MKTTLKIDLPTDEQLTAGLELHVLHPAFGRATQAVAEAERGVARRRAELEERERVVVDLPARVHAGEVKATVLSDAMRERDAAALVLSAAEGALVKAREKLSTEEKTARAALDQEIARRIQLLNRYDAEIEPVVDEITRLGTVLEGVRLRAHTARMLSMATEFENAGAAE